MQCSNIYLCCQYCQNCQFYYTGFVLHFEFTHLHKMPTLGFPQTQRSSGALCVRWAAAWLPKIPSKMCPEAWDVGIGLEPDNPAGIWVANLVLMPGSSQLWLITLHHWDKIPSPTSPSFPPSRPLSLPAVDGLVQAVHTRTQISRSLGQQVQWYVAAEIKERLLLGSSNPIILVFPIFL